MHKPSRCVPADVSPWERRRRLLLVRIFLDPSISSPLITCSGFTGSFAFSYNRNDNRDDWICHDAGIRRAGMDPLDIRNACRNPVPTELRIVCQSDLDLQAQTAHTQGRPSWVGGQQPSVANWRRFVCGRGLSLRVSFRGKKRKPYPIRIVSPRTNLTPAQCLGLRMG